MSFDPHNLGVLSYANGYTAWHYRAMDQAIADVMAGGFFNAAADMLADGDTVTISAKDGGAMLYVRPGGDSVPDMVPMAAIGGRAL